MGPVPACTPNIDKITVCIAGKTNSNRFATPRRCRNGITKKPDKVLHFEDVYEDSPVPDIPAPSRWSAITIAATTVTVTAPAAPTASGCCARRRGFTCYIGRSPAGTDRRRALPPGEPVHRFNYSLPNRVEGFGQTLFGEAVQVGQSLV